jgi:hypothetical protein
LIGVRSTASGLAERGHGGFDFPNLPRQLCQRLIVAAAGRTGLGRALQGSQFVPELAEIRGKAFDPLRGTVIVAGCSEIGHLRLQFRDLAAAGRICASPARSAEYAGILQGASTGQRHHAADEARCKQAHAATPGGLGLQCRPGRRLICFR